ncbi:MAG: protein kinase [Archangium sp.]|nr:protein kinase [Archangium sp.]
MTLVVEQLTPVRHREGFEELSGFSNGKPVSVGVTNVGLFVDEVRSNAFAEEVKKALELSHPHIARTLAIDASGPMRWAVAWERFDGVSLDLVLQQKGAFLPDEAVSITMSVAQALSTAHQRGLIHGGLSAQWVTLLTAPMAMEVKVAGFGLGLLPALVNGRKVSAFVDVSALGSLLHQLLTNELPQGRVGALPAAALHLASVLNKALGLDLSNRFRTIEEFIHALGEANRTRVSGGHVVPPKPGQAPTPVGVRTLGPWELERLLGEGAMGQVFLAKHALLGRQAAIKVLRPEQYQREDLIQRFFQEARSVNQINHEHIVEISDFGQELGPDGKPTAVYFVMELLQGETLTARLAKGPLTIERALHIIKQVASALAAAHRLGVVHRDVKTDNVFLTNKHGDAEYVKVLDFGVAKLTNITHDAPTVSTMDGAIIGTPTSMSPEQASGGTVDRRADVYAVGVLLYLLLSGKLPIDAENFGKLVALLLTKVPDALPERTPRGEFIPAWLIDVVRRCLEKDPLKRPQSMEELITALSTPTPVTQRSTAKTELVMPKGVDGEEDLELPPSRRGLYVGVTLGVLLTAGITGFMFWPRDLPMVPIPDAGVVAEVVDAGVAEPPVIDAGVAVAPVIDAGADEPEDAGTEEPVVAVDAGTKTTVKPKPVKLTKEMIMAAIDKAGPKFAGCAQRFPASLPPDGKIPISFQIEKSGAVSSASVNAASLPEPVRACFLKGVQSIKLPLNTGFSSKINYVIPIKQL